MNHKLESSKQPNILDVAEKAGVSAKTVSNVLTGRNRVRDKTRERVQAAIEELGYHPNIISQRLRYGRSRTITLAVPDLVTDYFADVAHEALQYARKGGYSLLIIETNGREENETEALRGLNSSLVDGAIVSTIALSSRKSWEKRSDLPVVLLGERTEGSPFPHVVTDNRESAEVAANHLIHQGCKKILFIGYQDYGTGALRAQGYRDALEQHGMNFSMRNVYECQEYAYPDGAAVARQIIDEKCDFDGLVCGSDLVAMGAIHELLHAGFRVPDDVKVIGWDGTQAGKYANPSLSTIAQDIPLLAKTAVDTVVKLIEGEDVASNEIWIPYHLIQRDSTAVR